MIPALIKWAGGKSRLADRIGQMLGPCHGTYIEPFIGSAAVFLARRAAGAIDDAILSDLNPQLINMYRWVRDDVDALLSALDQLPLDGWEAAYYDVRRDYNEAEGETVIQAARMIWLNRAGFNGLYRVNRKGKYNVPKGRYAHLSIPHTDTFRSVSAALQGVDLRCCGYEEVVAEAGETDQVYCDPPYLPDRKGGFSSYARLPFGLDQHVELSTACREAAGRGARVLLSNHDVDAARATLYREADGWDLTALEVARSVSRSSGTRKPVPELLASIGPWSPS